MRLMLLKLLRDPATAQTRLAELREGIASLQHLAGPGLKKFIETHDLPFSTLNALTKFSEKLLKGAVIVKEAVDRLVELADADSPPQTSFPKQG